MDLAQFRWEHSQRLRVHSSAGRRVYRIICHKAHLAHADFSEYLSAHSIVAFISEMTKADVCFDGVHAIFLEFVGFHFFHQTDSSAFLIEIDHGTAALFFNHLERFVELVSAVAAHAPEYISGGTG